MNEARVRDALAAIADEIDQVPELWDRTRRRITTRRRHRAARAVGAAAAALAIVLGAVAVVADGDNGSPIAAGPEAGAIPAEILAVVDGDVVVVSSADGSVERTLIAGIAGTSSPEVSVGPDRTLVYTRVVEPPPEPECTFDPSDLIGPAGRIVTASGALTPIVSPDGGFVAYRISECDAPSTVGLTALGRAENYQIVPDEQSETDSVPLAWMPDSKSLLVSLAGSYEIVSAPLGEDRRPLELPEGTYRAVFTRTGEVVVAYPLDGGEMVAAVDVASGDLRELFDAPLGRVMSLSYDGASDAVLVTSETERGALLQWVRADASERTTVAEIDGLGAALWSRAEPRVSDVVPGESIVVPDLRGLAEGDAVSRLAELGLGVAVVNGGPRVVGQQPVPGASVAPGSVVTLSLEEVVQPMAPVPDVERLDLRSARAVLEGAGFSLSIESIASSGSDSDVVFWQEPPAGSAPLRNRPVQIWTCGPTARCVSPPPSYVDGFEPATYWRPIDLAEEWWAAITAAAYPDADALAAAIAERLRAGFEQNETVSSTANTSTTSAEVWVRARNYPDDSAYGQDYRLHAELREGGWVLISGEIRMICARGGGVGGSCL